MVEQYGIEAVEQWLDAPPEPDRDEQYSPEQREMNKVLGVGG